MTDKTTEALKLAEEALVKANHFHDYEDALAAIREALAEQEKRAIVDSGSEVSSENEAQEPVAWHDKIKGMEVSVDVSTGEDDAHHRVFGRVDSVMLESCGAQEDIILVIEESRNYAAPVSAKREWVDLTDDEINKLIQAWYKGNGGLFGYARAVIAAFKEKNT